MEILIYTLCCLLVLSYIFCKVLYIKIQNNNQGIEYYKRKEKEYDQKIEDLDSEIQYGLVQPRLEILYKLIIKLNQ